MVDRPMEPIAHTRSGLISLHPSVYHIFIALAVAFVAAGWSFFGDGQYAGLVLSVVTLFFAFAIGIVADLGHIWRDHHDLREDPGEPTESFHEWLRDDVSTSTGKISGRHAAFMAALPVGACGILMVLLALVHVFTVG